MVIATRILITIVVFVLMAGFLEACQLLIGPGGR
jgi:hypothetical protein